MTFLNISVVQETGISETCTLAAHPHVIIVMMRSDCHCMCAIIQLCVFLDMDTIVGDTDSCRACWI